MTYALSPSAKALIKAYEEFLTKKRRIERFEPLLDLAARLMKEIAGDRYHSVSVSDYSEYIWCYVTFQPDDTMELILPFIEGMTLEGYGFITDKFDGQGNTRDFGFFDHVSHPVDRPHVMLICALGESKNCVRKLVGYKTIPAKVEPERQEPIYEIECREGAAMQEAAE